MSQRKVVGIAGKQYNWRCLDRLNAWNTKHTALTTLKANGIQQRITCLSSSLEPFLLSAKLFNSKSFALFYLQQSDLSYVIDLQIA